MYCNYDLLYRAPLNEEMEKNSKQNVKSLRTDTLEMFLFKKRSRKKKPTIFQNDKTVSFPTLIARPLFTSVPLSFFNLSLSMSIYLSVCLSASPPPPPPPQCSLSLPLPIISPTLSLLNYTDMPVLTPATDQYREPTTLSSPQLGIEIYIQCWTSGYSKHLLPFFNMENYLKSN